MSPGKANDISIYRRLDSHSESHVTPLKPAHCPAAFLKLILITEDELKAFETATEGRLLKMLWQWS